MLSHVVGEQRSYFAADSLKEVEEAGLDTPDSILDFCARHVLPGLPSHAITIKKGAVYRMLRNFSLDRGLVKNVRAVVTDIGTRLVTIQVLNENGSPTGDGILIPRISFTYSLPSKHTLLRRQFPLAPAYATTFNSCQGLTLDRVGIDLTHPVFSHGQLYTALSRIRRCEHARVRLLPGADSTVNVTYKEILV